MTEWTVGQEVALATYWDRRVGIMQVTRVLKRFVELSDGSKWSHDGRSYPRGGNFGKIRPVTDKDRETVKRQGFVAIIERARGKHPWVSTPVETLDALVQVLRAYGQV